MINEFEVALYKRPNRYGLFHRPTKSWTCFGKKAWLIRKATELNMEMSEYYISRRACKAWREEKT